MKTPLEIPASINDEVQSSISEWINRSSGQHKRAIHAAFDRALQAMYIRHYNWERATRFQRRSNQ